ncbi:unnamed protein product [Allacma fusca]|uniref:C2H2-type domain-containing protein n=1 Tax=Allacma fusca TaxID=39272 RepID=A0A8J2PYP9_9HEXA|nr:unnamed protein product [Allacma fusca]
MDHYDSENDLVDHQTTDHEGRYSGGMFYHIPKERFTTALKITGMIRLGIEVCAECERHWDERNCNPLQDECGHDEDQNSVRDPSPNVDLEIVDVGDILSGNIISDPARTDPREAKILLTSERGGHSLSSRGSFKTPTAGRSIEGSNSGGFIKNHRVMRAGESLTSGGFKKNLSAGQAGEKSNSGGLKTNSRAGNAGENPERFVRKSNRRKAEVSFTSGVPTKIFTRGVPGENSNTEVPGMKANQCSSQMNSPASAGKCIEHEMKTVTLFNKNDAPDPPLPTRDNRERPFTCSKCPASFSLEHHLKLHEPIHLVDSSSTAKYAKRAFAYIKHILNKDKSPVTSTSAGPTKDNSGNGASSTILNTAADHLPDVEGPVVQNQSRTKTTTEDDDLCILKINYMLPKKTETPESPNVNTRVTVSYEDDGTTSVLFHGNFNNENVSV